MKYRVDQLLGVGGMAVVLAGTHIELDSPIAIKLLLPDRATSPDAVRRFLTEARAAAKLKSTNIARISDVGTCATRAGPVLPFIVMERLDGVDLATLMEHRGKLTVEEAIDYLRQACLGLAEAHALSIIHRDIKPANLFLTRTREGVPVIKVLDFGISKSLSAMDTHHQRAVTSEQEVMGSPGYMSPEQVKGAKDLDTRTDVWSVGVVLHELITGKECFPGDAIHEIFANILHGEPNEMGLEVPTEVRAIIARCLEKDPSRRYQTMGELADALARALDQPAGVPVKRSGIWTRGPMWAAAVAAVVVIGGFAIFARARTGGSSDSTPAALSLQSAVAKAPAPPPQPATIPPPPTATAAAQMPSSIDTARTNADFAPTDDPPATTTMKPRPRKPQPASDKDKEPALTPGGAKSAAPTSSARKRTEW
jgi:serine/threonine-protein kinase